MNTPAHLIFGVAAFGKAGHPKITTAAILGGLIPDFSLYYMVAWSGIALGMTSQQIFSIQYFSDYWQAVFAIDNSIFVWAVFILMGWWAKCTWLWVFGASGALHIVTDFLLHNDDARRHFWPASDWVFNSPISYWDPAHYGLIFGPIEVAVSIVLLFVLWRRFRSVIARLLIALVGIAELTPNLIFPIMFGGF